MTMQKLSGIPTKREKLINNLDRSKFKSLTSDDLNRVLR